MKTSKQCFRVIKSSYNLFICMTKDEQYKLLFENWKKYTSEDLQEVSIYQYSGEPKDPKDPAAAWDPKTITKTANPDIVAPGTKGEEITAAEMAAFAGKIAGLSVAQTAGENIGEIFKFALGAIGKVLKTALRVVSLPFKFLSGIVKKFMGGTFASKTGVVAAVAASAVAAGIVVKAGALAAVGYGLYKIYKYVKGDASESDVALAVAHPEGPGTEEYAADVAAGLASLNIRSWESVSPQIRCAWCKENKPRKHIGIHDGKVDRTSPDVKKALKKVKADKSLHCINILKKCDDIGRAASTEALTGKFTSIHGITHNLAGQAKTNAEAFVNQLVKIGITNKYVLAGAMATQGKETGFKNMAERANYSSKSLKDTNSTMHKKLTRLFRRKGIGAPSEKHLESLSYDKNPGKGKGAIALLNLVYGYRDANVKKRNYQTSKTFARLGYKDGEIKLPILKNGEINPDLYDAELAGWKYRGRGPFQTTFKATYASTASLAGLNVDEILSNPDLLLTDPVIAARMSAAYSKIPYNRIISRDGAPQSIEEGIRVMVQIAGAPFAKSFPSYLKKTLARAMDVANRHIRIGEDQVASK